MNDSNPDDATQPGDELLLKLADDYLRRYRSGEQPTEDEYAGKHPELAERIRELFPAMIAMEQPGPDATVDLAPSTERVGAMIGRYKLLQRIGEGGFGVVYMAEQQRPVRRKVAFKIVKPGMDSRQVLARFEAERQALAIMDHPNIAKVFDAGATDSGRPYFVMELIKGEPITEFCDRNHFSPKERLELFSEVCHAVQHAHQKGIIHRDIKPTNVLVEMHDTTPAVKVIDFGVAKALGQELTDKTLFTEFAQLLGTPLYMSPEQAGQSSLDIDTRSDIYSLGVLLYELLTGTTPFDKQRFKKAVHDEIFRIIREEEPPAPSTRLSESKETLPSISAQRQTEPAKLTKLVRGELDWIVMKCLEKDRGRRYESASALAQDVERYLADEPVEACPPSAAYRFRKLARRNKAALLAGGAIAGVLLIGTVVSTWQAVRATRAEALAESRLKQAEAVTEFLVTAFESADPAKNGRTITVAEVLNRAEERLEEELPEQPLTQATMYMAIAKTKRGLGLSSSAIAPIQKAIKLRELHLGKSHPDTLYSIGRLAAIYLNIDRPEDSVRLYQQILDLVSQDSNPDESIKLDAMHGLGEAHRIANRPDRAIEILEQVLKARRQALGDEHKDTIATMYSLGVAYHTAEIWDRAIPLHEKVVFLWREKLGADHPNTLFAMNALAIAYYDAERYEDALRLHEQRLQSARKRLGDDHPDTALSIVNIGYTVAAMADAHRRAGRDKLAEQIINEATARYLDRGQYATAFIVARSSGDVKQLDSFLKTVISRSHEVALSGLDALVLGELCTIAGRADDAIRAIRAAIARQVQPYFAYKSFGIALLASGKPKEASEAFRTALSSCRQVDGTFSFSAANADELTGAYFLDLVHEEEFVDRLKKNKRLACFPWFYIGQKSEIEGNSAAAIVAYKRCVEVNTDPGASVYCLARWRLWKLGQPPSGSSPDQTLKMENKPSSTSAQ